MGNDEHSNGMSRFWVCVISALLGVILAGAGAWFANATGRLNTQQRMIYSNESRIGKNETQITNIDKKLDNIDKNIDWLIKRMAERDGH